MYRLTPLKPLTIWLQCKSALTHLHKYQTICKCVCVLKPKNMWSCHWHTQLVLVDYIYTMQRHTHIGEHHTKAQATHTHINRLKHRRAIISPTTVQEARSSLCSLSFHWSEEVEQKGAEGKMLRWSCSLLKLLNMFLKNCEPVSHI